MKNTKKMKYKMKFFKTNRAGKITNVKSKFQGGRIFKMRKETAVRIVNRFLDVATRPTKQADK